MFRCQGCCKAREVHLARKRCMVGAVVFGVIVDITHASHDSLGRSKGDNAI